MSGPFLSFLQSFCFQLCAWSVLPGWLGLRADMSLPVCLSLGYVSPTFLSVFREADPSWGGHCPACLAVGTVLGSLSSAGELSFKPPWHEDHRLYCYLSWSWEVLLLIRCSENGCLINTIDITGHWPMDLKCSLITGSAWLLVSIIFTWTY